MAVTTDDDAPRRSTLEDVDTESLEALTAAATTAARSPDVDLEEGGHRRGHRPARRGPVRGGTEHAGRSAAGRRVHLHGVFPGAAPQPDRRPQRRPAGLPGLRLTRLAGYRASQGP